MSPKPFLPLVLAGGLGDEALLATATDAQLATLGFKKGTRLKVLKWQDGLRAGRTPGPLGHPPAAPTAAPVAAPAATPMAVVSEAELAKLKAFVVGNCSLTEAIFDLLLSAGIDSLAALRSADQAALGAAGLKKGPRLKLETHLSALG